MDAVLPHLLGKREARTAVLQDADDVTFSEPGPFARLLRPKWRNDPTLYGSREWEAHVRFVTTRHRDHAQDSASMSEF